MRATRTLFFSDIEGSTELLRKLGDRYAAVLERHRELVRSAIAEHDGRDHGSEGDSVFASFATPSAAIRAAAEAQRALAVEPWPRTTTVRIRIGLHVGEVAEHGDGLVGLAIHQAARVAATANGGQIVTTEATLRLAGDLPEALRPVGCGRFRIRDLGEVELYRLVDGSLPLVDTPLRANPVRRTNLGVPAVEPIGRDDDARAVLAELTAHPIVTVVGPGGIGKTTLAAAVASTILDETAQPVWFIDLASVREPGAVLTSIADTLGVPVQAGLSLETMVTDQLSERPTVLVVDNCEHLLDETGQVIRRLVEACPDLHVLATSQRPLGVRRERVHRLGPIDADDAVALFVERAKAADASFDADPATEAAIADICRRLDGVPLAIELAAARTRAMGIDDLGRRLDDRFKLLRSASSDTAERQRTLAAAVEWSYQLLTTDERELFCRLAVFSGTFDLAAAEAVADEDGSEEPVMDLLTSLVDRSMVVHDRRGSATRYRLLETMREFGTARLIAAGSLARQRDRHLAHFTGAAARARRGALAVDPSEADQWFDDNWDELRSAVAWALETEHNDSAERLVAASGRWAITRLRSEHLEWCRALERLESHGHRLGTAALGCIAYWYGTVLHDEDLADRWARLGLERAERPDHPDAAWCVGALAAALPDAPRMRYELQLAIVDATADPVERWPAVVELLDAANDIGEAACWDALARAQAAVREHPAPGLCIYTELFTGHYTLLLSPDRRSTVRPHYERALALARRTPDRQVVDQALRALALDACISESLDALSICAEAVEALYATRYWQKLHQALDATLLALTRLGRYEEALVLLDFVDRDNSEPYGIEQRLGFRDRARVAVDAGAPQWPGGRAPLERHDVADFVASIPLPDPA